MHCPTHECHHTIPQGGGLSWLFPFKDGAPPVGWEDAGAYLILPALLVLSQWASQKIISPPVNKDDPAQQQTQAILAFLPVLIGACLWVGGVEVKCLGHEHHTCFSHIFL